MNPSDQARQVGVVDSWLAQYRVSGYAKNPAAALVLCDTGAMAAGYYDVGYVMAISVAEIDGNLTFQWRNAANSASLWIDFLIAAGAISRWGNFKGMKIAEGERLRVYFDAALTGFVSGGIIAVRRA